MRSENNNKIGTTDLTQTSTHPNLSKHKTVASSNLVLTTFRILRFTVPYGIPKLNIDIDKSLAKLLLNLPEFFVDLDLELGVLHYNGLIFGRREVLDGLW